MGNPYDEFAFDDDQPKEKSEGGKLREKLEAAIKLLKDKDKEIEGLKQYQTQSQVSTLLKDIPEKFHKLAQKELADNPTADGLKSFVEEYGDLWGAEQDQELEPDEQQLRSQIEQIQNAQREARNIKDEPFKMPSQAEFQRMNYKEAQALAERARNSGRK